MNVPGRAIVVVSWVTTVLFAALAVPAALGVDAFDGVALGFELAAFFVSLPVWVATLGIAIVRSARGDQIAVGSLFLVEGEAPRLVRLHLFGSLGASCVVAGVTAVADPFGVMVPMLPLGLVGLWGARHGRFPPRRDETGSGSGPGRRSGG